MLIAMPARLSTPVNASLVNWLPWSVLKTAGQPVGAPPAAAAGYCLGPAGVRP